MQNGSVELHSSVSYDDTSQWIIEELTCHTWLNMKKYASRICLRFFQHVWIAVRLHLFLWLRKSILELILAASNVSTSVEEALAVTSWIYRSAMFMQLFQKLKRTMRRMSLNFNREACFLQIFETALVKCEQTSSCYVVVQCPTREDQTRGQPWSFRIFQVGGGV